jgi:glutamate-1-semialdehyde aminotransferase
MIESVGTASVQGSSLRVNPQAGSSYAVSSAVAAAVQSDLPKYGTRLAVRLDSAAQRAILEVRSSETGEVVNQYPSEAQMRAFQQAARLEAAQAQAARQQTAAQAVVAAKPKVSTPAPQQSNNTQAQQQTAPAPQPKPQVSIPAPQPVEFKAAAAPEPSRSSEGASVGAGESVLV